jgi:hypothetical protein
MSLDIYLSRGEDRISPCPHCDGTGQLNHGPEAVYEANITHNLGEMAEAAGIYGCLWRPEEHGITKAGQLIEPLAAGLAALKADPERFEAHDAPNGWGTYRDFVPWVECYLEACRENPDADVRASR